MWNYEILQTIFDYIRNGAELIAAHKNKYWEKLYFNIRDRIEMYGNQLSLDEKWFSQAIRDHYAIIDAILSGQFRSGRDAMATHIRNVRKGIARIRQSLPPQRISATTP